MSEPGVSGPLGNAHSSLALHGKTAAFRASMQGHFSSGVKKRGVKWEGRLGGGEGGWLGGGELQREDSYSHKSPHTSHAC